MLKKQVIKRSNSPYSSPIIMIQKPDGTTRFCIDYRELNKVTIKEQFPIPNIQEMIEQLQGSRFRTTLDLSSGYWQNPIK